jgi:hypothetical protein
MRRYQGAGGAQRGQLTIMVGATPPPLRAPNRYSQPMRARLMDKRQRQLTKMVNQSALPESCGVSPVHFAESVNWMSQPWWM